MVDESGEQEEEEDDALTFAHRRRCRWTTEIRLAGEASTDEATKLVSLLLLLFSKTKKKKKETKKELPDLEQHKTKEEVKWHTGRGEVAGDEEEGNAVEIGGEEVGGGGGGSELPDLGGGVEAAAAAAAEGEGGMDVGSSEGGFYTNPFPLPNGLHPS